MLSLDVELQKINDLLYKYNLVDALRTEVEKADRIGLSTDERLSLVCSFQDTFLKKLAKKEVESFSLSVLVLFLNYIFGCYWGAHKELKKSCEYNYPDIKNTRTYGVRGEVDYLRAVAHRDVLTNTVGFLGELEKKHFDDPSGQIMRKLTILRMVNEIVSKQPILKYEVDADATLDAPLFKELVTRDALSFDINKSYDVLNNSKEDDDA